MRIKKSLDEKYQKKSERERVLLRPDTYIGTNDNIIKPMWVHDGTKMKEKNVEYNPGFLKIFDEVLTNASDHANKNPEKVTKIEVIVDQEKGFISVFNNGPGIDIEIHGEHKVYIPELIFANLGAGTNFDDTEERTSGGRNGLGAKLAAIFSTKFEIETIQGGKKYNQIYTDNLSVINKPSIKKCKKEESTKITFYPDLKKLNTDCISDVMLKLFEKRTMDIAACTEKYVNVKFNDKKLNIKSFEHYIDMFCDEKQKKVTITRDRWKAVFLLNPFDSFTQVSYVNGIATTSGGNHVEHVVRPVIKKVIDNLSSKHKDIDIKYNFVKDNIMVFIYSLIVNPSFKSQTKEELTTPINKFGSRCDVTESEIKQIIKLGIDKNVLAIAQAKSKKALASTDGKKKQKLSGIPKLDDANKAGGRDADKCTLILTEGDSAKTFAVAGLSKIGRDYYGIFPLKGKLLNVRKATDKQVLNNEEIKNLKLILGLQQGKEYKTTKELRYGHILILTDQDLDGFHIKGLLINFFQYFWPSLVKQNDFITCLQTPIVKCTKGNNQETFYNLLEYNNWKNDTNTKSWKIKYYKGLGTSNSKEAKECFTDLTKKQTHYTIKGDEDDEAIDLAFNIKRADNRKTWIKNATGKDLFLDNKQKKVNVKEFFDKEFIQFSIADNVRSIPNMMDGLKPSQRKVLYGCLLKNLKDEIKVDQLRGYISEKSSYHHGDMSLNETIISMAQNFVGSNNINLLEPCGMFGSRRLLGKDSASPRYIFTKLNKLTRQIFLPEDDKLLNYLDDDGYKIEPEFYWPIIPMLLVNGSVGIGTGYSTNIPCYNPLEIINVLEKLLENSDCDIPKLVPWYKNFKGKIEPKNNSENFISYGKWKRVSRSQIEITELPIGVSNENYKEKLDTLEQSETIEDINDNSSEVKVKFTITMSPLTLDKWIRENNVYNELSLTNTIKASNMKVFDHKNKLISVNGPEEIIYLFYRQRKKLYKKRYDYLINYYKQKIKDTNSRLMFVIYIVEGKIKIGRGVSKSDMEQQLINLDFPIKDNTYDYLLSMKLYNLTKEKIEELEKELNDFKAILSDLESKTYIDLWKIDLTNLKQNLTREV